MKLMSKVIFILVFGIIVLVVVEGYFAYRRELVLFQTDADSDEDNLGAFALALWDKLGDKEALELFQRFSQTNPKRGRRWRWVWLEESVPASEQPKVPMKTLMPRLESTPDPTDTFDLHDPHGDLVRVTYVQMPAVEQRLGAIEVIDEPTYERDVAKLFMRRTLVLSGVTLLLGGVFVVVVGHELVAKPMRALTEKTRRIGKGDLSGALKVRPWDEFGEMAEALNSLCRQLEQAQDTADRETAARIATTEQLRHAERLHTVGRLASGIAHEMGTPLNVVSGRAGLIASGKLSTDESKESAEIIKSEAERMTKIIRQLLDFARRKQPNKKPVDLKDLVAQLLELLDPLAERANYTISVAATDEPIGANADAGQIQQVLTNLLMNASQAMPDGGNIEVAFHREYARPPHGHDAEEGPFVSVSVRDEGKGIPQENLAHIFEPFFTTKAVGQGTGLGLSVSFGIVEEHGGWIDVRSELGKGSCFTVYLPEEVLPCGDKS